MVYKRRGRRGGRGEDDESTTPATTTPAMPASAMPASGMTEDDEDDDDTSSPTTSAPTGGRRRRQRGGTGGVASSAATYAMNTAGNGQTQWNNVFNNSETMNAPTGNGLWSTDLTQNVSGGIRPLDATLGTLMQGGRRGRRKRTRRGGNLLDVIGQAAVPFGLIALQQGYSNRRGKKGGRKSRRTRKRGGRKSRRGVKRFGPL